MDSTEAAKESNRFSFHDELNEITSVTPNFPIVMVPVLSKSIAEMFLAFLKADLFLIRSPFCAEMEVDIATTRGIARPRAWGQVKQMNEWCKKNRHNPLEDQKKKINQKLNGHYSYYEITGNSKCLRNFCEEAKRIWFKWLNRRSGKKDMRRERFSLLLERYKLVKPGIKHSFVT